MTNKDDVSSFNDVKHDELRHYNRGQVLSNIFEEYASDKGIPANKVADYLYDVNAYLCRIPPHEVDAAKTANRDELIRRGHSYG